MGQFFKYGLGLALGFKMGDIVLKLLERNVITATDKLVDKCEKILNKYSTEEEAPETEEAAEE